MDICGLFHCSIISKCFQIHPNSIFLQMLVSSCVFFACHFFPKHITESDVYDVVMKLQGAKHRTSPHFEGDACNNKKHEKTCSLFKAKMNPYKTLFHVVVFGNSLSKGCLLSISISCNCCHNSASISTLICMLNVNSHT